MHAQPQPQNLPVVMYLTLTIQLSCITSVINVVASRTTWTKEEQYAVVRFYGLKVSEVQKFFADY
jgi:hypothetical protein